jgi:hypothetical protein
MLIRYTGGRSHYRVSYNRQPYFFTLENNRTLDIQEKEVINYIFKLPNRGEFEVVVNEPVQQEKEIVIPEKETEQKIDKPEIAVHKKRGRPKKGDK